MKRVINYIKGISEGLRRTEILMNIMFKNTHNIENKKIQSGLNQLQQASSLYAFNNSPHSKSFKSTSDVNFTGVKVADAVKMFGADFGESAEKHFDKLIHTVRNIDNSGLKVDANDILKFPDQKLPQKALELLCYPVVQMPFDFANALLSGLKKIPGIRNLVKDFNPEILAKKKDIANSKSHAAAIRHYVELLEKGEKGKNNRFNEAHRRLAPLMPTYKSETERSLTRFVTGIIPAFFLANDAYNLSMYMNNNKEMAKKEKKRRFNQELARIGLTTAATYGVMSLFSKQCNKNMYLAAGLTSGIVLVSEVLGRLMAGNPVLPVSAKKAKEYALKRNLIKQNKADEHKPENNNTKSSSDSSKKGFLTASNILKVLGGLVVFGFAADKASKIKYVSNQIGKFNKWYKSLYTEKYTINRKIFDDIILKLKNNNFKKLANPYELTLQGEKGERLTVGEIKNKGKFILIHQILAFPVTFTWKVLTLPYNSIIKPIIKLTKPNVKVEKKIDNSNILQNGIRFLEKIVNDTDAEFTKKVNESLISSLDNLTKSSYQNSALSTIVKVSSSAVTSGFLIADNYNMVMIDSQGKDKDLAGQKAKERAMQRGVRLTYESFILKMFTDIFAGLYNSSLIGAQLINGGLRIVTEVVERKSVGLPLNESTQEEIKENEIMHLNATGLKGSYFRAMATLTGKKTFAERENNNKKL